MEMKWFVTLFVLFVVAIGGTGAGMWYAADKMSTAEQGTNGDGGTTIVQGDRTSFCSENPELGYDVRLRDSMDSESMSYVNGTLYVENLDTGSIVEKEVTTGGSSDFENFANLFDCTTEKGYKVYVKFDGTINSDGVKHIKPEDLTKATVEDTIEVSKYTPFKVKGYDLNDRAKLSNGSGDTDYQDGLTATFYENDDTSFDGTADESINAELTLAPNTSDAKKGEAMYIAVNTEDESNLVDWDESSIEVRFDGETLTEVSEDSNANLEDFELRALTSYEKIYKVDKAIGENNDHKLEFYVTTEDGKTADFDPVIKIVALGDIASTKADKIYQDVGFKDNSAKTELASAQTITFATG